MSLTITQRNFDDITEFPEPIFKYRNWSDVKHQTILTKQVVFMARPTSFEDPKDCKLLKRYNLITNDQIYYKYLQNSKEQHPNWTRQQHRKFARDWLIKSPLHEKEYVKNQQIEHFKEFDERFGVLSLTANPLNCAMWEKYSDGHKGVCIGFNGKEMFRHLGGGGKVEYYDILPDILPMDSAVEEHAKQVFSKEKKWEFEEEYRTHKWYPQLATDADRTIKLPKHCFKQIIFGANMIEAHRNEIISICKEQELAVDFYYTVINEKEKAVRLEKYQDYFLLADNY